MSIQKLLLLVGTILLIAGLLWPWIQKLGLGQLPGDIFIKKDNFSFYFPLTTTIILSILLSLILWFLKK